MKNEHIIETLYRHGRLSAIDVHFSRFMADLSGSRHPALRLAAALLCHTTVEGNTCLNLEAWSEKILLEQADGRPMIACPTIEEWTRRLRAGAVVGCPGQRLPMILDGRNRLYLFRYWQYEKDLADFIIRRATAAQPIESFALDLLRDGLKRLFPQSTGAQNDRQIIGALMALMNKLCVISGGPGTGKTTVVARILALLLEQPGQEKLNIRLAAPTGKAAAKLAETLKSAKTVLDCKATVRDSIPTEAQTIHRLLKPIPGTSDFTYHAQNPIEAGVVVIDEASMVDLALMVKLTRALPEKTRLILLGDKDQLASVEAGAVLGDICSGYVDGRFSPRMRQALRTLTGQSLNGAAGRTSAGHILQDCVVALNRSFRFPADSGIGAFSQAVNQGEGERALSLLSESVDASIKWQTVNSPQALFEQIRNRISINSRSVLTCEDPAQALEQFNRERWLCAFREGPWGVKAVNEWVELSAHQQGLIGLGSQSDPRWYVGRPVLITANDYQLGLFNGDLGVALPESDGRLSVFLPGPLGELRKIPPHRLGAHDTAWAMTVHKSQGSEFDHVHLILPDRDTPLLSRELIYTAVTRAKTSVTIYGTQRILSAAIARRTQRHSGLQDALWGAH